MPAISFKLTFAPLILDNRKRCTIRKKRKRPIKVGDKLILYTGLRTKKAKRLKTVICTEIQKVEIRTGVRGKVEDKQVFIDNKQLTWEEINDLAIADGFQNSSDFFRFFFKNPDKPNLFIGQLIKW